MGLANRKHVSLVKCKRAGRIAFILIGPDGNEITAFGIFVESLLNDPPNTMATYCSAMADFYNYFYEAALFISGEADPSSLSRFHVREIISSWKEYLVTGIHSDDEFAKTIATVLPSPNNVESTADLKHAALSVFLRLSERIRLEALSLKRAKLKHVEVDYEPLLAALHHLKLPGYIARGKMVQSSMLSAALAGVTGLQSASLFPVNVSQEFDFRRVFPLDEFSKFVDALISYRDKAIYCLYAALGCRSHEGLQLLWEDIDVDAGTIQLINPKARVSHRSYRALSQADRQKLAWKGRETKITFLIEPFASMFFEYLELYQREEYIAHGRHNFVFQVLKGKWAGRPYFSTCSTTRAQAFHAAAKKARLPEIVDGPHTLRHAYGTYLLNYMPREDGSYGMEIGYVRVVMGHASIKNTEKYARVDHDLIRAHLKYGNLKVFHSLGSAKTLNELKLEALRAQIDQLEKLAA